MNQPWKSYEEVEFREDLVVRWIREGEQYVCRLSKEQMEALKKASEK
jgi:glutamyl/glutaminyl-tRNA synthetase